MLVVREYLWFYFFVLFFFVIYSPILDMIFMKIDYGHIKGYSLWVVIWYLLFFIISSLTVIPIVVAYNFIISNIKFRNRMKVLRLALGLGAGFFISSQVPSDNNLYIGELRPLRAKILYSSIGLSVEIARWIREYIVEHKYGRR